MIKVQNFVLYLFISFPFFCMCHEILLLLSNDHIIIQAPNTQIQSNNNNSGGGGQWKHTQQLVQWPMQHKESNSLLYLIYLIRLRNSYTNTPKEREREREMCAFIRIMIKSFAQSQKMPHEVTTHTSKVKISKYNWIESPRWIKPWLGRINYERNMSVENKQNIKLTVLKCKRNRSKLNWIARGVRACVLW